MRVLVLGGAGFLGRHVVAALAARGHGVVIGSRDPKAALALCRATPGRPAWRSVHCERLIKAGKWDAMLDDVDAVVNCVGILRERGAATYERVHHLAVAALTADCARLAVRLIHVSALGLHAGASSRFISSKLRGEQALLDSSADVTIVRPSLLDGEGGYGARWLRAVARWPVHCVPADATGRIAVLAADDAGAAIAELCTKAGDEYREVELGGTQWRTLEEHLAALRAALPRPPAIVVRMPALLARLASHVCDLLHVSPFSFGHLELLRRDNVPRMNALPLLLDRPPCGVPSSAGVKGDRGASSARGRAILPPNAVPDGGSRRSARAP